MRLGLIEDGIKRFSEHFKIEYIGKGSVQKNVGDDVDKFEMEDSKKIAVDFAEKVISCCTK